MTHALILTLLEFTLGSAGVIGAYALGARVERDNEQRKARRYYAALTRPAASTSPDEYVQDAEVLRAYQQEVWSNLR